MKCAKLHCLRYRVLGRILFVNKEGGQMVLYSSKTFPPKLPPILSGGAGAPLAPLVETPMLGAALSGKHCLTNMEPWDFLF